jgi:cation diffusion facilitator family transporter
MPREILRQKAAVAWLSVISNTTLVIVKITVGLAIGSVSVISEGIHSGVDLLADGIALFAVKKAGKPADEDHPFGHGKFENISGTIEALLIFVAAGWILWEAIEKLIRPLPLEAVGWGVLVMILSATANYLVSHQLFRVARSTGSVALQADGWHLRTDVYTSAGVMLGLAIIWTGERVWPGLNLHWVDSAAAIAVALLIFKTAYDLTLESGRDLLDAGLPQNEVDRIQKFIAAFSPTVRGVHRLRTRKSGSNRFVEFHMRVDANMTVVEAHKISHAVSDAIKASLSDTTVTIHIEPCQWGICSPDCLVNCPLDEEQRKKLLP